MTITWVMGTLVVLMCFSYGACILEARKIYLATNETLTSYVLYPGLHLGVVGRGEAFAPLPESSLPLELTSQECFDKCGSQI